MRYLPLLLLCACSSFPRATEVPVETQPEVEVAPEVEQFLAKLQVRMMGHTTLPDAEVVLCLYGTIAGNVVRVERIHPPMQRDTLLAWRDTVAPGVHYRLCGQSGEAYLGTVHSHPAGPWGDGCWFSDGDLEGFAKTERDVLIMVTCSRDTKVMFLSRVKRGYSLRAQR